MSETDLPNTAGVWMPHIQTSPSIDDTPGVVSEMSPDEAADMGAFKEEALGLSDALKTSFDGND